jgi:DNA-binding MarR family transcriptional regulator
MEDSFSVREDVPINKVEQSSKLLTALQGAFECLISRADSDSPLLNMPILQLKCLRVISRNEGQKLVNVATKMNASTPGVSRLVDRLVRQGLVERHPDPSNRRAIRLMITDSARAMLCEIDECRRRHIEKCIDSLNPLFVDQMISNVIHLTENAQRKLAE